MFHATGTPIEFTDTVGAADPADAVVVIDQPTCAALGDAERTELVRARALIVMGGSIEDDGVVDALRRDGWNHVIRDADDPDDAELVVTSVKLLSGDIFGLEKYLAWGVKVNEASIRTYEEKREALLAVTASSRDAGARRPTIARVESVCDELLMNAMYDAPAVATGTIPPMPRRLNEPIGDHDARLRWASDGRYFAVSVEDRFGALAKDVILDHLQRARVERGRPRSSSAGAGGAGLGLYFILSSVTRFIVNIEPGRRTEVVCLFDLKQGGRDSDSSARSLHVFGR
ncbi:MAG TPA: hypothetical protein VM734_14870 [Kofleriaceae bacterium]|jgi:hypothetical protein|nr:hypothetical protein [Kofleriaceae bacterium]